MDRNEHDEYMRRWRRKFWAMVAAGIPFGLVLGYYLLRATR
jgi:hypothetical protein